MKTATSTAGMHLTNQVTLTIALVKMVTALLTRTTIHTMISPNRITNTKFLFHTTFDLKIPPVFTFQSVSLFSLSVFQEYFVYFVSVFSIPRIPLLFCPYVHTFVFFLSRHFVCFLNPYSIMGGVL